jgi:hypothetical protein
MVSEAHARTIRAGAPVVLTVDAHSPQSGAVGLEICLAPLTGPEGAPNRTLGLLQPISMLSRLMGQPIATLSLRAIELAPEVGRPSKLRLVALNGLRVA